MNTDMKLPDPSPLVAAVEVYDPSTLSPPVDLRLSGNEGAEPPSWILNVLSGLGSQMLNRYPEPNQFEERLAEAFGLEAGQVLVTAGADDAIERALRSYLAPGRELVLPVPTFEMIERYAALAGGTVIAVPWLEGALPVEEILEAVNERTSMIMVVTPNSPTGLAADFDEIKRIAAGAPGVILAVDLAYTEFADEDLTKKILELPGSIVFRTMSKAWGMAGTRVGFAMGQREIIKWLRSAGHPYAVSSLSLALAEARFFGDESDVGRFVDAVRLEREELRSRLLSIGSTVNPSMGNFLLARFEDAAAVRDELLNRGIGVRAFTGKKYLEQCLRISLPGNRRDFERLVEAFGEVADILGLGKEDTK